MTHQEDRAGRLGGPSAARVPPSALLSAGTALANGASSAKKLPAGGSQQPRSEIGRGRKVALAPGRSPLDWARLQSSNTDLRGIKGPPMRVDAEELAKHARKGDAWTAIRGKVYNITPYLEYHPGGPHELMRCAGRDGTKLFTLTHAWVNADHLLGNSQIGFYTG